MLTNILSLTAAFGAVVWVFQEGLGALGTASTGTLGVQLPVLLFCIAFGLSMDYQLVLIARIREYWLASHRGWGASDESVARGVAHTARVITAAALIMMISFAALMAAQVGDAADRFRVDGGGAGRRHARPDAACTCVHASARPGQLVGAKASFSAGSGSARAAAPHRVLDNPRLRRRSCTRSPIPV